MIRNSVDIFCRVIDNYGDAGVCWRLARQMAFEHGVRVRLIIDRLDVLASFLPRLARAIQLRSSTGTGRARKGAWKAARHPPQGFLVDGVRVFEWKTRKVLNEHHLLGPAKRLKPAKRVIAAFGCDLPLSYRHLMVAAQRAPRWFNLEYLSAESWVADHHLLPSPKSSGLIEHFFFPGFSSRCGGLIREQALLEKRDAFLKDHLAQEKLSHEIGLPELFSRPRDGSVVIFVFSYPGVPWRALIAACHKAAQRIGKHVYVLYPEGVSVPQGAGLPASLDECVTIRQIKRLPQERFDEILWLSDGNFVRGEDSFVRAIWAGKPMVWNIYPQDEQAHAIKLEAFLKLRPSLEGPLSRAWNGLPLEPDVKLPASFETVFLAWFNAIPALTISAREFAQRLSLHPDLCRQLLEA